MILKRIHRYSNELTFLDSNSIRQSAIARCSSEQFGYGRRHAFAFKNDIVQQWTLIQVFYFDVFIGKGCPQLSKQVILNVLMFGQLMQNEGNVGAYRVHSGQKKKQTLANDF